MVFATCSFPEFQPAMGIPVRISNGYPRYTLRYALALKLPLLYPDRTILGWERERFIHHYTAALDQVGVDAIRTEAQRLRDDAQQLRDAAQQLRAQAHADVGTQLVLLCFEQLTKKPGSWCHRNVFAAWWRQQTGEEIPELGARPAPEIRSQEEGRERLF